MSDGDYCRTFTVPAHAGKHVAFNGAVTAFHIQIGGRTEQTRQIAATGRMSLGACSILFGHSAAALSSLAE